LANNIHHSNTFFFKNEENMKEKLSPYESIFFTHENGITVNKGFAVRSLLISFNT